MPNWAIEIDTDPYPLLAESILVLFGVRCLAGEPG